MTCSIPYDSRMCTFKVRGSDPGLAQFAQRSGLNLCLTIEDGVRVSQPSGRALSAVSLREKPGVYGFHVAVSNRGWDDLQGQFSDAVAFIRRHRDALTRLSELKPDSAVLSFAAEADPSQRHVVIHSVYVPVDLCRASADVSLGIGITLYFAGRRRDAAGTDAPLEA